MAKFKKKKSAPVKKEARREDPPADAPGIERPEIAAPDTAEPPRKQPEPAEILSDSNRTKLNRLFWIRVILAAIAGTAATFIFEPIEGEERRWASIGFMIVVFAATIILAKSMRMQLPSSDRKKLVTQAIGSYVFIYLFMWILSYTMVNVNPSDMGIPPPVLG